MACAFRLRYARAVMEAFRELNVSSSYWIWRAAQKASQCLPPAGNKSAGKRDLLRTMWGPARVQPSPFATASEHECDHPPLNSRRPRSTTVTQKIRIGDSSWCTIMAGRRFPIGVGGLGELLDSRALLRSRSGRGPLSNLPHLLHPLHTPLRDSFLFHRMW